MLLRLLFRNAFRSKLRSFLTILAICVAVLAFGLLRTVIGAWYAGVAASSANRLVSRNAISLVFPLPISYKEKIRAVPGVTIVSEGNWFGGVYIEEKNFFANFAVEVRSYLAQYPEFILDDDQKEALFRDRKGCVVGQRLARRFGWRIGDTITLKGTIFPGNWELVVRAIYRGREQSTDETLFFFHWDYLNESVRKTVPRRADQVGFYTITIDNPDLAAQTAEAIDQMFRNSFAETLTETEKAFQLSFVSLSEAILTAVKLVSLLVIFIIMVVAANTMAMSVRERMGEFATFKTLGFGGFYIGGLILGESLVITTLGGVLGIALTFPAAKAFGKAVGNYFPVFTIELLTIYLDLTAALAVGVVAALFPMWRAITVPIAEGLRRIG
jgi:putative ABC transport system permease protein